MPSLGSEEATAYCPVTLSHSPFTKWTNHERKQGASDEFKRCGYRFLDRHHDPTLVPGRGATASAQQRASPSRARSACAELRHLVSEEQERALSVGMRK